MKHIAPIAFGSLIAAILIGTAIRAGQEQRTLRAERDAAELARTEWVKKCLQSNGDVITLQKASVEMLCVSADKQTIWSY